jgi:hypothetical protein
MAPEVLEWLRDDAMFDSQTEAFRELNLTFKGKGKAFKTEENRKWIRAGSLGGPAASGSLCGLSTADPLPGVRLQAWFRAFRQANEVVRECVIIL